MRRGIRITGIKVVTKKNGKRYIYRRVRGALIPLPDLPENDPRFLAAFVAAEKAAPPTKSRHASGTIGAACTAYLGSHDHRALAPSTRKSWRRTIDRINAERGRGKLCDLRPDHLRRDVRSLSPGAASNRLKAWRSVLKFAVAEGWISTDPSLGIKAPRGDVKPHRQWTRAEIDGFRTHWATGTPERTAFEVIFWTGARCVDAVRLGWQMVDAQGWLTFVQEKTGGPAVCPIRTLPPWCAPISSDHAAMLAELPTDRLQWIVTRTGKPRSVKGLSQWFSAAASTAGLPDDCTAHGLRKARAAGLAEINAGTQRTAAWTGHASLSEVAHYTRGADQRAILGAEQEQNMGNHVEKFPNAHGKLLE